MIVTFDAERARYEAITCRDEAHLPRDARWRWDPKVTRWWTTLDSFALKLAAYADTPTRERLAAVAVRLEEERQRAEATAAKSRATDAAIAVPAPDGLAYLPYQRAGIAFALDRPGVLIADEPGLGKTIQAAGILNADTSIRFAVVICPASLKLNWKRELDRWLARPKLVTLAGAMPSAAQLAHLRRRDDLVVLIINFEMAKKWSPVLSEAGADICVVDECHFIKSKKAQRTVSTLEIARSARRKVCLTGTPIVNRPAELFTILELCDPEGMGSNFFHFAKRYCAAHRGRFGWDFTGASHLDELQERLRGSIMVRRLKKDVLTDLPPKQRQVIAIEFAEASGVVAAEADAWERRQHTISDLQVSLEIAKASDAPADYERAVEALREAGSVAFTEMSKHRKAVAVAKVPAVVDHLRELIEADQKVVCMAAHHEVVDAIAAAFPGAVVHVDGRVSIEERQRAVDRFQTDATCRLFVGTIRAAGVGLTLTASSTVVFAELDWVPGNVSQAEDRCHRIGQRDSVLVQHIVLDGSIDQHMAQTIIGKQAVIDDALDTHHERAAAAPIAMPDAIEQGAPSLPGEPPTAERVSRRRIEAEAPEISPEIAGAVHACLRLLAGMDGDRARELNGIGFSRFDGALGHRLAEMPSLTPRQAALGRGLVRKYRRQLDSGLLSIAMGGAP